MATKSKAKTDSKVEMEVASALFSYNGTDFTSTKQVLTALQEKDTYIRSLQSERSKLQNTIQFILDKLDSVNGMIELPKKINFMWVISNAGKIIELVKFVIDAIKEIKTLNPKTKLPVSGNLAG